jgi:hypothetical protein
MRNEQFRTYILSVMLMAGGATALGCSAEAPTPGTPAPNAGGSAGTAATTSGSGGGGTTSASGATGGGGAGGSAGASGGQSGASGSAGSSAAGSGGSGFGGFSYGGSTAAPTRTCETAEGTDALLDDFEDSDVNVNVADHRDGKWSTNSDGSVGAVFTGTAPSAASGREGSVGWCISSAGHTTWGANMVLTPLVPSCGYDASAYQGVCFWAKGQVDAGGPVEFGLGTGDTVPTADGGACQVAANCWYGYMASVENLSADWQQYCFAWDEFAQWAGTPEAAQFELDPASIVQMEWKFTARGAEAPTNGELCIDDVTFMTE